MVTKTKEIREGYKMTDLGEMPINWEITTLGSMTEIIMGQSPSSSSYNENGEGLPFYQGKAEFGNKYPRVKKWCSQPSKISEANDVLFSVRAPVGEVNMCQEKSCIGRGLGAIRAIKDKTNNWYLYYALKHAKYRFDTLSQGSTFTAINGQELRGFKIAFPPMKEQQKIAEILSTVDEQIENTDQLISKTKELKKGLMQQLLTKGIGHTEFKKTEVGEIPQDWEIVPFKSVCSIVKGQVDPNEEPYKYLPHIGNANVEKFTGRLLSYNLAYEDNLISGKYLFNENHVLYGKINPHFSKVAFPKFEGLCSADMYPIECKGSLDPLFLKYILLEKRFTKQMISASARTGIPKVNREELERFRFILPPFKEQQKIAEILSTVDDQIESYEQEKEKYVELKKGLMQQLLTGKIRVTV